MDAARPVDRVRCGFALVLAWYVSAYVRRPDAFLLLDHVDLAIHEAGHVVFSPFGEFVTVAGGTLLQLLVPVAFVLYFLRAGNRFAAAIVLFWVAQSIHNVAVYMGDARAQVLPLVGGEYVIHDWAWMLSRLRLLHADRELSRSTEWLAIFTYLAALGVSLRYARRARSAAGPAPADERGGSAA